MANGDPLNLAAATVAVDVSHRDEWLNRIAHVVNDCGRIAHVRVTDTGRLYEVGGWFRYGIRDGQLRHWPVNVETDAPPVLAKPVLMSETEWLEDDAHRVVADFPRDFFAEHVACETDADGTGDTTKVWLWVQ